MIETNKYYILKDPLHGGFKVNEIVHVAPRTASCIRGKQGLIITHWEDKNLSSTNYCECSAYRFKSLKNTWWKHKKYMEHFKLLKEQEIDLSDHKALCYYGTYYQRDIKEKVHILMKDFFKRYTLCEQL